MTDTKTDLTAEIEAVTGTPQPANEVTDYDQSTGDTRAAIEQRMAQIQMDDTGSIIGFGSAAQEELQQISQSMLKDVKNKDIGPAGDSLRGMVSALRGFSVSELDLSRKRTFFDRILGRAAPISKFMAKYEDVQAQIDDITTQLHAHEHQLLKDVKSLDLLYEKTLAFYDELALYIAAGEEKLRRLDAEDIPALEAKATDGQGDDVIDSQQLRDLRAARDDLERRVHDLRLTRQVTMQSLPSIRLVQENDKSLVMKINSTLVNTVPLWETQLAQAVTIQRSEDAADAVKSANDLTNDLLTSNAKNLREANAKVRTQVERGVFDIDAVKQANAELIATIEESLQIADQGKAARNQAEGELQKMEAELKDTLAAAKSRKHVPAQG
ncbi:TelA-like protein [Rhodobacteraceae bacterium THAF1]|uniref:toxic anion resistance protein n=1 Tax=Palleronia sp. THAF1 TaxID=2587842 RepID=UPI000F3ACE6E|nr:toxic anion resistance protein [Palleronia sp. THAF1]QFU09307.1 TelA-like protein [Palleronia sp. THAF1]VDC26704.1 TelA-like protein [Rhodobacteraceae bacterium THAF1]